MAMLYFKAYVGKLICLWIIRSFVSLTFHDLFAHVSVHDMIIPATWPDDYVGSGTVEVGADAQI